MKPPLRVALVHHQGLDSRLRARSGRALEAHWASIHSPPFEPLINKEATLSGGFGTPSGARTLDTLIKSQVLYQLS